MLARIPLRITIGLAAMALCFAWTDAHLRAENEPSGPVKLESLRGTHILPTGDGAAIISKLWARGDNSRTETVLRLDGTKLITIQLGDTIYEYVEGAAAGSKQRVTGFAAKGLIRQIEELKTRGEKGETLEIDGDVYDEYRYWVNMPREMASAHLSRTTSLPHTWITAIQTGEKAMEGRTMYYRDMEANVDIPAERFQLPPNVTFHEATAAGYAVGDVVVVVARAQLRVPGRAVGSVNRGDVLNVENIHDKWLWVRGRGAPGWLDSGKVLSLDDALQHFTLAIRRNPRDQVAYRTRAEIWRETRNLARAIDDYSQALRLDPNDALAAYGRAYCRKALGDYGQAIDDFSRAIRLDPKNAMAYNDRGLARMYQGDDERALEDFDQAVRIDLQLVHALLNRGHLRMNHGMPELAIEDYDAAIRLNPKDARVYNHRGVAWAHLGDDDRALEDYNRAIQLNFAFVHAYYNRGGFWSDRGEHDRAIEDYSEAIRLAPGFVPALVSRAVVWEEMAEYDKVIEDSSQAIQLDPDSFLPYFLRGLSWHRKGAYERAIEDFDEALHREPQFPPAYLQRGAAWSQKGEFGKAIADFEEALRLDPELADGYSSRGSARAEQGEYEKALADYDEALRLDPGLSYVYVSRGEIWRRRGDFDRALEDVAQAADLTPDFPPAHNLLAWILATCPDERFRDGPKAVEHATRACELTAWEDVATLGTLAAAWAEAGEFDKAVEWQTKALKMAPEDHAEDYRRRLDLYRTGTPYREALEVASLDERE